MNRKEFGLFFADIREKSGYRSQRELAEKSGISHSTINRIEAGTHKVSVDTLKAIAPYLKNVTYEELLEKSGVLPTEENVEEKPINIAFLGGRKEVLTEDEADAVELALEIFRKRKEERMKEKGQK